MKSTRVTIVAVGLLSGMAALSFGQGQAPAPATAPAAAAAPAAAQTGPGVQAPNDAKYAAWIASQCKNPAAARGAGGGGGGGGGRGAGAGPGAGGAAGQGAPGAGGAGAAAGAGGGGGGGRAPAGPFVPREYTVTEIPGIIAAGQKWTSIWKGTGNNADGIIATDDGGILAAQNTDSTVMKIDKNGSVSIPYKDTNTGGAVSRSKNGALFIVERGLPASIWQLEPKRQLLTNMYMGEPLDCIGGVINDLSADSKGGVYFTMGPFGTSKVYYANPAGMVTEYGENLNTNGIVLSPDEKTLYVTGRIRVPGAGGRGGAPAAGVPAAPAAPAAGDAGQVAAAGAAGGGARGGGGGGGGMGGGLVAFDVQPNGSLTNQRQFATVGGDGIAVDEAGRVYATTAGNDIQVVGPDGKVVGVIPTPIPLIAVAFSGPDKKTLYGVANNQRFDEIITIPMLVQGYKGRAK